MQNNALKIKCSGIHSVYQLGKAKGKTSPYSKWTTTFYIHSEESWRDSRPYLAISFKKASPELWSLNLLAFYPCRLLKIRTIHHGWQTNNNKYLQPSNNDCAVLTLLDRLNFPLCYQLKEASKINLKMTTALLMIFLNWKLLENVKMSG